MLLSHARTCKLVILNVSQEDFSLTISASYLFIIRPNDKTVADISSLAIMRVTPPFWYAVFMFYFRRYTVHKGSVHSAQKNPVILYTDNTFYFKKVQFSSRNTINKVKTKKKIPTLISLALILYIISSFIKHQFGEVKFGKISSKHNITNVYKNDCACACHRLYLYLLYVNGNAKNICFCS